MFITQIPNENVTYPLSTTLYYDELRVVTTKQTTVQIEPYVDESVIYKNNFDSLESLEGVLSENVENQSPTLTEIAAGNKAVKYSANLSGKDWEDIFKAQFNLQAPYEKTISGKVVMSYDVYFPTASVGDNFGAMKAQAALSCGSDWTWVSQKSWPEFKADGLTEDTNVPGYKKVHVEINMNDFETWDNEAGVSKPYPFDKITPIQAVIPCFAGANSSYQGDLYLDNLVVMAVDESEDIPPVEGDLTLDLNTESWSVVDGYQYTGQSTIRNENVGDKTFLVLNMDYSNNSDKDWSEAKFDYTHPSSVDTLSGYNAFKVDLYYKPTDMTAGSFAIKVFSKSPDGNVELINKDAAVPVGEPVDIPGLEGYYKAEFVLDLKIPAGTFNGLTFGLVGKNTNFVGDIYLDNMRFTQVTASDIYVDSTIAPVKGPGIQIVDEGRSIQTASGNKVEIASEVALVDANANEAAKNLYAYLKAVGDSDSVIFGHQNDTHHKAGSKGDGFSNSDTEDVTGSIAGVVGIDSLSLTGNEASTWDTPEAERIANVAAITKEAAAKGALITLSAHMPNFDVIDKRVKAYEAGNTGTDSDSVGYWDVNGDRQYNFSGYTPGTLTGNVVARIMPGQDLNYLYTDYLDLIADYAKAVEGDGITILFRPLHENTGSWFWWGAALCDEQAYINLYRYTVDYLKETKGVHNMLYVYGPGSEAANAVEYSARYPGDAYVDMIGYDLYHSNPSPENEAGYLQSISKQNEILKQFATAHNKLYAITETGVADKNAEGADVALQRTGNKVMDWYMQLLNEISDDGVSYFLVWANFSENGSFYLPYVTEKKENGVLHGHEMMDEFIKFYNDGRSVFATDMNSGFKQISGVTNTTKSDAVSGYITAPQSGDRILTDKENPNTRIAAKVSGVDSKTAD
ncbi:MAG: glycoside hydrolase family 26 protein, partial [Lachnospiraceae bacterium]|nr:glycoside hydrolase family 26 protein [Lachnospiraceae bacterium]